MATFTLFHYAFDGELFGEKQFQSSNLSPKWLAICSDLVAANGPIFEQSMGGTLERFEIKSTAGICQFNVGGTTAFSMAVLPAQPEEQSSALLNVFVSKLTAIPLVIENSPNLSAFEAELRAISNRPSVVIVNWLSPNVSGEDQEAAFQLALHFAAAYLQWQ